MAITKTAKWHLGFDYSSKALHQLRADIAAALKEAEGFKKVYKVEIEDEEIGGFTARVRDANGAVLDISRTAKKASELMLPVWAKQNAAVELQTANLEKQRHELEKLRVSEKKLADDRAKAPAIRSQAANIRASGGSLARIDDSLRYKGIDSAKFWSHPEIIRAGKLGKGESLNDSLMDPSYRQHFGRAVAYVIKQYEEEARAVQKTSDSQKALAVANRRAADEAQRSASSRSALSMNRVNTSLRLGGFGTENARFWGDPQMQRLSGMAGGRGGIFNALSDPKFAAEFKQVSEAILAAMRREERSSKKSADLADARAHSASPLTNFARGRVALVTSVQPAGQRLGADPVAMGGLAKLAPATSRVPKGHIEDLRQVDQLHKGIMASLGQTAINMGKWLVFYRLVRDTMMMVETGIRFAVQAGLEYTKQTELQTLGLRATLAEHYKVTDSQDQTISGAQKLVALQAVSKSQWQDLQAASLAVVGQTQDLMMLYSSIVPYAGRLGADLGEVQKMTKATAVAASLMDISFSDARTAVVSLLQGRSQQKNRLVTLLGISKEELKDLKDTPALFTRVMSALEPFLGVADDAEKTLSAMGESFQEFVGIAAKAAEAPFVKGFKDMVVALKGMMFEGSDKLILKRYAASQVRPEDKSRLYGIVAELAQKAGLPMPKVFVIPEKSPNAFATGRNPEHASVAATEGLLAILDDAELSGVMAHELAHGAPHVRRGAVLQSRQAA